MVAGIGAYWRAVAGQAFAETWSALLESPMQIILALLSTVAGILVLVLLGDEHAARAEAVLRTSGGIILCLAFPLLFFVKLVAVPVSREKKLRNAIEGLQKTSRDVSRIELAPCVSLSQEGLFPAKYLQVSVYAVGNLIGCQVMLNEVERMAGDEAEVIYTNPQNAAWNGTTDKLADLNDGQEQRANLFSVSRNIATQEYILFPQTVHKDERLRLAVNVPDLYRLTIHASSKTSASEKRYFMLHWGGSLDDVGFWELKGVQETPHVASDLA